MGSAFGDNQGAGYLQIGNRNGIVISWSDTRIVAKVAEYTASGVVEVTENEQHSNSVPFKILSPVILGYGPYPYLPKNDDYCSGGKNLVRKKLDL